MSEIIERKVVGNLEYTLAEGTQSGVRTRVRLLRCPACGTEFPRGSGPTRWRHFAEQCGWDEIVGD